MTERFLSMLCCPACKGKLSFQERGFSCHSCSREYGVIDNIPMFVSSDFMSSHHRGQVEYFEREEIVAGMRYALEPWQEQYVRRFLSNFPDVRETVVIDCGTGSGYMTIELAQQGAQVIACDLTIRNLVRLRKIAASRNLLSQIDFVCCLAESLPLINGVADFVIENAVLEHLPQELAAIREINRVSKAGAGVMVVVPLHYRYLNPLLIPLNYIHDKRIGHLRRYDEDSLREKFHGWHIKKVYYTGHTAKVVKVVANMAHPFFDETAIERDDACHAAQKWGASNVCAILRKHQNDSSVL